MSNRCEGCDEPIYLSRFGYTHTDTTLNVDCDARPKPTHPSIPKAAPALPAVEQTPRDIDDFSEYKRGFQDAQKMLAPPDDKDAIIGQLRSQNESLWKEMQSFQHNTATGEWIGSGWTPVQMARVLEESNNLRSTIRQQAETIRQMTELLREYKAYHREWAHTVGDDRCPLCLKADLLLKEPA